MTVGTGGAGGAALAIAGGGVAASLTASMATSVATTAVVAGAVAATGAAAIAVGQNIYFSKCSKKPGKKCQLTSQAGLTEAWLTRLKLHIRMQHEF